MKSTVWNALFVLVCSSQIAAQGTASSPADVHLLDAVQAALARHPALEIQRQEVEIGKAVKQQASGAFDQLLESGFDRQRLYSPLAELTRFSLAPSNAAQLDASYSKLMRSGIAVSGSIGVSRQIKTPLIPGGLTTSSTRLQLLFPLMRGRGTGVTTASERAAGLQASSSVLALRQATATVMARVVSSYWGVVAAGDRVASARITREAAANDLQPRVDLSLNVGYTSLAEGRAFSRYWSAVAAGVEGPDVVGRIAYHFPLENHVALGRFAAADARLRQAIAERDDLVRSIRSSMIESYSALRNSLLRLGRARESVDAFQDALRGEQDKLTLGIGSIINML